MHDHLIFLVGAPRSGTTLAARMLGAHSAVFAPAETHLLTPLAHLGFYAGVERAPYDPIITRQAASELVCALPGGEADYLAALRAYTDAIYGRLLAPSGRALLLDKTPAYALVLDFVVKLYPRAKYVVLTRHPLAVWSSYVDSFFDGDAEAAHRNNPLLERYVPAIARFLREAPVPLLHLRYETLVTEPEAEMRRTCAFLGLGFEPAMVEYGAEGRAPARVAAGLGDPTTVGSESRPTARFVSKWAESIASDPTRVVQARAIVDRLLDPDLETWGHPRAALLAELDAATPGAAPARGWSRHALERRLLVRLRRNIHHNAFGRLVRRIRFVCDVLLR